MREKIAKEYITEFDEREKNELLTYFYDEKGSTNALKNSHDDLIMADALCLFWLDQW